MMNMVFHKKAIVLLFGFISVVCKSQPFGYFEDALRFSQTNYALGSTARMQGIGGAQVALGGDISSAASNPAGLGFFNKSVFTFTPSMDFSTFDTKYSIEGRPEEDVDVGSEQTFRNTFNFANLGFVLNYNKGRFSTEKFKGGSLAISLGRTNTFNADRYYAGINDYSSIADVFASDAGTLNSDQLPEMTYDAYQSFLISAFYDDEDNIEGYFADFDGFPVQSERITESGSQYKLNIAWGGNYNDVFYFGGGMAVDIVNYSLERNYIENDFLMQLENGDWVAEDRLNAIYIDDVYSYEGAGVSFNVGAILRPVQFLTIGASYTTPSYLSLDREDYYNFEVDWLGGATAFDGSEEVELTDYFYESVLWANSFQLRTPSRLSLGSALFIGKSGFLTGDVEWVDYSTSIINSTDFTTAADNDLIEEIYQPVMNIRVGGEYRFDQFRLRGGYALFPSPYKDFSLYERESLSVGFGYRNSDYFVDVAVVNSQTKTEATPYAIGEDQPLATTDINNTSVSVTLGFNF